MQNTRTSKLALLTIALATTTAIAPIGAHAAPTNKMAPAMMSAKLTGSFKQITHATSGTATVSGNQLTLSNFATGMGPKLHVYIVQGNASSNDAVRRAVASKKFADLGVLKSIKGVQSYTIPANAKVKGSSVVVWCDQFKVVFGSAKLG